MIPAVPFAGVYIRAPRKFFRAPLRSASMRHDPVSNSGSPVLVTLSVALPLALASALPADGAELPAEPVVERPSAPISFGRDVRPILSDRCFQCHGPDPATRAAGLRLDSFEEATRDRDGSIAIVPGDPEASELLARVHSERSGFTMPPPDSGKRALSDEELDVLTRWIEEGAEYEEHWAFQRTERPEAPALEEGAWGRNPIDAFVAARLANEGLSPSAPARPLELLRRLFLEVTGLPPEPSEIAAFEDALAGGAGADAVLDEWLDRLLTEEPYVTRHAERMARPWLDQSRYADTSGIHMDAGRQAWAWRDWVIEAYRANMPFDRFTIEQLAGDLLPEPTTDQRIATGFNRNHVTTDEGGAINAEYLVEYAVDRVKTTSAVFLGMTAACAQCHDHKFDPISMEEFYGLFAYFNSNDEPGLYSQQRENVERAFEPFIEVPTAEQGSRLDEIDAELAAIDSELGTWTPEEEQEWTAFHASLGETIRWAESELVAATAEQGTELTIQPDGSALAGGANPADDAYTLRLRTDAVGLRTLLLEALPSDGVDGNGSIGRASNGNVVIRSIQVDAVSVADPNVRERLELVWAYGDYEQTDQDFSVTNVLSTEDELWWALGGHVKPGPRAALLLASAPFGYEGGTELVVRIDSASRWSQHTLARPRLSVGAIEDEALALLPTTFGRFHRAGPFSYADKSEGYGTVRAPEHATSIVAGVDQLVNPDAPEGATWRWEFSAVYADDTVFAVPSGGRDVNYLGREVYAPSTRTLELSLGSDDGFILVLDGERKQVREVDRGPAADQDRVPLELASGRSLYLQGIVNTGGPAGAYFRAIESPDVLSPELVPMLYPGRAQASAWIADARGAWQRDRSPRVAELETRQQALVAERDALTASTPLAMVMRELPEPRPTYLLMRGAYDHPDTSRVIPRGVPAALGTLPEDAPDNRLGLAQWIVSRDNPLTARVTVNRLWAQVFGTGIVSTTDDFGYQGSWPSHPELLDWLAVEFMESGWDVQHVLRLILSSATWRQGSDLSTELAAADPGDRLLGRYPRKRLSAEAIRDQALFAAGLLVERVGGRSVKPYQPEGLWREVAMLQSNTRFFERGNGEDLWRRSLYTYWKRAAPPPSMLTFDAPTREFCVVERATTDTPLQALVLMNDEQFLEAARVLAQRTLAEAPPSDFTTSNSERLEAMFRRVLTRAPEAAEEALFLDAIAEFRWRYGTRGDAARELLEVGEAEALAEVSPVDLAAWTLAANALLNLFETTNPR